MNQLYLENQGTAAGPYPLDQVDEFVRDGIITKANLVSISSEGPWITLQEWQDTANKPSPLPPPRAQPPLPLPSPALPPVLPVHASPPKAAFRVMSGTLVGLGHGTDTININVRNSTWKPPGASIRDYIRIDNQTIPRVLIPDLAEAYLICGTHVELHYAPAPVNVLFAVRVDGQLHNYIPAIAKVGSSQNGAKTMMMIFGCVLCLPFFLILPLVFAVWCFVAAARIGSALSIPSTDAMRAHLAAYSST